MSIEAVIFDMDGLMFDTERLAKIAWTRAMADHGYSLSDEVYLTAVGRNAAGARAAFITALGSDLPIDRVYAAKERYLAELLRFGPPLKPHLSELLDGIAGLGILTAVASSTAHEKVVRRLAQTDLRERFAVVVGGDEVARGKPAPDLFLLAASELGVVAASCVVLEDSEAGIRAAAAAGMTPIMVPDLAAPSPALRAMCAAVVGSLAEVLAVLLTLRGASA